jgi:hypothetical protein
MRQADQVGDHFPIVGNSEVTISSIELRVETEKVSIKERGHFPFDFCESGQASVPTQFTP